MVKCSIIIAVLESYEIVRRQMLYYKHLFSHNTNLANSCEFILVDDGSEPSLRMYLQSALPYPIRCELIKNNPRSYPIWSVSGAGFSQKIVETRDKTPWTQHRARNIGAGVSRGQYLLMTDIDHILTREAIQKVMEFSGGKLVFRRQYGILNTRGEISRDKNVLIRMGCKPSELGLIKPHPNTFCIKREIFQNLLKGYDSKFFGRYGGGDLDLNRRYDQLAIQGRVGKAVAGPVIFVFPNPKGSEFHPLKR